MFTLIVIPAKKLSPADAPRGARWSEGVPGNSSVQAGVWTWWSVTRQAWVPARKLTDQDLAAMPRDERFDASAHRGN